MHAVLKPERRIKLAGTAQRVVKGAWLFSTSLVVEDAAPVRDVLTDVYQALQLPLDPAAVGVVEDAAPGVTVEDVVDELQLAYGQPSLSGALNGEAATEFVDMSWADLLRLAPSRSDQ